MLIRSTDGHLQCISERPGAFILFTQGPRRPSPDILIATHPDAMQFEHYHVMGVAPRVVPHGSSLWRVRADGSMQLVEDNHDSSD